MSLPENGESPEQLSTADFLKEQGVNSIGQVSVRGEFSSEAEAESRLREKEADGNARRRIELLQFLFKDALINVFGIALLTVLVFTSLLTLAQPDADLEDKAFARSMLSTIVAAAGGYVLGKGSNNKP